MTAGPDLEAPPADGARVDGDLLARTPPHHEEAEQAVLGSAMLSKGALADLIEVGVQGRYFYRPAHEVIWDAIIAVQGSGDVADPVTVAAWLQAHGDIGRIGGAAYLHTCLMATPTAANALHYAGIVLDRALRRGLTEAGAKITQLGLATDGGDADDLLDAAEATITALRDRGHRESISPFGQVVEDVIDAADPALAPADDQGIRWGLAEVDKLVDPLEPGQLAVIAGWSGGGKTMAALTVLRSAAFRQNKTVLIFTPEQSRKEIGRRIIAAEAGVSMKALKRRELDDREWQRVFRAQDRLQATPLWIDDCTAVTLAYINSGILRYKPDLVIVDQIPILIPPDPRATREQQLDQLAYGLKRMAGAREVPILTLAQLNRAPMARQDRKPNLRDVRGSDAIGHASDVVILIHDPTGGELGHEREGETDLIIGKQRDGISDKAIPVGNQGQFARFVDLAPPQAGPAQGALHV